MTNLNSNKPKTTSRSRKKPVEPKKICPKCNKDRRIKEWFYMATDNTLFVDGRIPICKECVSEQVDMTKVETLIEILRKMDKPFFYTKYKDSLSSDNPFGAYMKAISMPQYSGWGYLKSEFEDSNSEHKAKGADDVPKIDPMKELREFELTADLVIKWGTEYEPSDIYQLEKLYHDMVTNNIIDSTNDDETFKLLCKMNLKMNQAINNNQFTEFKNISAVYQTALKDAGLRRIDKKGNTESMGIRTFSQIAQEVEKDGFLPKFEPKPLQSIVDGTILHLENYTRRFLNMQTVSNPTGDTPKVVDYYDENEE